MAMDIGNYAKHAKVWDWGGVDNTSEYEFWGNCAARCGKNVLIPMCALGEAGSYLVQRGFSVTAFDITPEMIEEGKKRFGTLRGLQLLQGDIRKFHFEIPPADFCFVKDFGHLHTLGEVKEALTCIGAHLREGGVLMIETSLPAKKSSSTPPQTFYPKKQIYPDKKVWKTGDTRIDAETGRCHISQTVYIEEADGRVEQFDHSFYLQSYSREAWRSALAECGFEVRREYRSRDKAPWRENDEGIIFETAKKRTVPLRDSEVMYLLREYRGEPCGSRVEWLTADDTAKISGHLVFCGKKPKADGWLSRIYESGTAKYCLLFADGLPVGRGAVEPYSENMWEAADIYVAKEYRNRGLAKEILRTLCKEILSHGKIVSCRTEQDNSAMRKVIEEIGFYPDGGDEHERF